MITKMKSISALTIALASGSAFATFMGPYEVSNWTQSPNGGSINLAGAPDSVSLTSNDDGSGNMANTDFTIVTAAAGTISFNWAYTTNDSFGSTWDPFGWLLNGIFTQLTVDELIDPQNGLASINVSAGNTFGFRMSSLDSGYGPATATISNFSFTDLTPVPEPASLALLGIGLAGLGVMRRNKNQLD